MKLRGVVRGSGIELEHGVDLPEGTRVELEVRPSDGTRGIVDELRAIHARQLERWGKPLDLSVQFIREHRDY